LRLDLGGSIPSSAHQTELCIGRVFKSPQPSVRPQNLET